MSIRHSARPNGNDQTAIIERRRFVSAFNDTMVKIWKERLALLGIVDTGALYRSVAGPLMVINQDVSVVELGQKFLTYGLYVNYGHGREVFRGNPGDIGRPKVRKETGWFDVKYMASVHNLREFFTDSLAKEYLGIIMNIL